MWYREKISQINVPYVCKKKSEVLKPWPTMQSCTRIYTNSIWNKPNIQFRHEILQLAIPVVCKKESGDFKPTPVCSIPSVLFAYLVCPTSVVCGENTGIWCFQTWTKSWLCFANQVTSDRFFFFDISAQKSTCQLVKRSHVFAGCCVCSVLGLSVEGCTLHHDNAADHFMLKWKVLDLHQYLLCTCPTQQAES